MVKRAASQGRCCLQRRPALVLLIAGLGLIVGGNLLVAVVRGPEVERQGIMSLRHRDWFNYHLHCEDTSDSCFIWASRGGCKWDSTTQHLCKATCGRCDDGSTGQSGGVHSPHSNPLMRIAGYEELAEDLQRKRDTLRASEDLGTVRHLAAKLNYVRLSKAGLDPATCQRSDLHQPGAALRHEFYGSLGGGAWRDRHHSPDSIQAVCRFELIPTKNPDVECADRKRAGCTGRTAECYTEGFAHVMRLCDRSCGFCNTCADAAGASCAAWVRDGQCRSRAAYMAQSCAAACGFCLYTYDPTPPHFVALWSGLLMPTIGFGTAGLGEGTAAAVAEALRLGYRHVDTAQAREWYREDLVAQALRESGVPRDEVFLTTKIHPRDLGYQPTLAALDVSLARFNTTYMDLVLLHYPACFGDLCGGEPEGTWQDSWRALEDLVRAGKALAIGVSNFGLERLAELAELASIPPAVVQHRSDLLTQVLPLQRLALALGMQFTGYSTMGTQYRAADPTPVLSIGSVQRIARDLNTTAGQVALRYALGSGQVVIPRSSNPRHMNESLAADRLSLRAVDLPLLRALDGQHRLLIPHKDT